MRQPHLYFGNTGFHLRNFIIDTVLPFLQILVLAVIVRIIEIQSVDLLSDPVFGAVELAQMLPQILQLFFDLFRINLLPDPLPDGSLKLRVAHQLADHIRYGVVDDILAPLVMIIAGVAIHMLTVLAGIIEVVPVVLPVALLLPVDIPVHVPAADRAFQQAGEDVLVLQAVLLLLLHAGNLPAGPGLQPVRFRDDSLMHAVVQHIIVRLDNMIFIPAALLFLVPPAAIGDLSAVHGIV